MPAIQPARLKLQASLLAEHFEQPAAFLRSLHYLLDFYSDRAVRHGESGKPRSLMPSYNVRAPVLRHLLLELEPLAEKDPAAGLSLSDALWGQNSLEFRLLACMLLGKIPLTPVDAVLERVQSWSRDDLEEALTTAILTSGLARIRKEQPQIVIQLSRDWLKDPGLYYQQLGLRILPTMISNPEFQNLPSFFPLIQPFILKSHPSLRPDLLDVIKTLAHRSPRETAYFLRQLLDMPENPDTGFIIRQCLEDFPEDIQLSIRKKMKEKEPQ